MTSRSGQALRSWLVVAAVLLGACGGAADAPDGGSSRDSGAPAADGAASPEDAGEDIPIEEEPGDEEGEVVDDEPEDEPPPPEPEPDDPEGVDETPEGPEDPADDAPLPPDPPNPGGPTVDYIQREVRVWHWNVAGQKIHRGRTDTGLVRVAVDSIRNRQAQFVSFNEICMNQYRAIRDRLIELGWPADETNFARFSESIPANSGVCQGSAYGNAIFSKQPLTAVERVTLPSDGRRENRTMLCASLLNRRHLRFCTTHITPSNALAADGTSHSVRQLRVVLSELEAMNAEGDTVIIAGDFNAQPHYARMNRFYSSALTHPNNRDNRGHYREVDDDDAGNCRGYGERTTPNTTGGQCGSGNKIDMIFVRQNRIVAGRYSGDSLNISSACSGACSDHRILIGTIQVRVQR